MTLALCKYVLAMSAFFERNLEVSRKVQEGFYRGMSKSSHSRYNLDFELDPVTQIFEFFIVLINSNSIRKEL